MVEIGHVFKLGTKYSLAQNAVFLDNQGKQQPVIMGCYGIGVSRLLPAIVQTNHDQKGIIWPKNIAPFALTLVVLNDSLLDQALEFAQALENNGLSVLVDDRACGAGVKFNDAALIGSPFMIVMGKNYAAGGKLEVEVRRTGEKLPFSREEAINFLREEYGRR